MNSHISIADNYGTITLIILYSGSHRVNISPNGSAKLLLHTSVKRVYLFDLIRFSMFEHRRKNMQTITFQFSIRCKVALCCLYRFITLSVRGSILSGNDVLPNRPQVVSGTNSDPAYVLIYAWPDFNDINNQENTLKYRQSQLYCWLWLSYLPLILMAKRQFRISANSFKHVRVIL